MAAERRVKITIAAMTAARGRTFCVRMAYTPGRANTGRHITHQGAARAEEASLSGFEQIVGGATHSAIPMGIGEWKSNRAPITIYGRFSPLARGRPEEKPCWSLSSSTT